MSDSVVGIGWDLLKSYVVVPMERGFGYVISSKRFAIRLGQEVQKLENEVERVGALEEQARNNVREFSVVFLNWKGSADEALAEARQLLDVFVKAPKTCCYGTLPDPKSRYRFSRKAEDKIEIIKQLTQDCIRFRALDDICFINSASGNVAGLTSAGIEGKDVVQPTAETASTSSASTSTKFGDDGVFESRALITRDIMDALANNSNSVVGVYGMGGVGKSTLLVDVESRIRKEKLFDLVAKADVSENPDIKTIQGNIAEALSLTDIQKKETIEARAKLLHSRLKEEGKNKKVLIILDNLWKSLNLESVGIPCRYGNKVVGCKLLLTSRDREVLKTEMGCDKDFPLGELKKEEAKRLFEELVGDKVHDDDFKPLVDKALHKCAGFPFLIVNMAKYFRHASLSDWKIALNQIKLSKYKRFDEAINKMLQMSYNHLKDEDKSLLALCVACGTSKPSFENLVRYGMGLRLFREADDMEDARETLRYGIRTLQDSSLLLEDGDAYGFKIHDLVRDFVTSIASRDHPLLVFKDEDKSLTELSKDKVKSCTAVCFPYIDMKELPQELDCPELQIFLLSTNNKSLNLPSSLFYSTRKLVVLNLTGMHLTFSPSPFQFLENLHTLCLENCLLNNVAILGELKRLEILSLVNSNIHQLPKEIGQLVELRLLDLNHCSQLEIIEPGVLQSLVKLEELYMKNSFNQWNLVKQTTPTNAGLIELNVMTNLRTMHMYIPNMSMLPEDLNLGNLSKYDIQIGKWRQSPSEYKGSTILKLNLNPLSNVLRKGCIQSILGKTDHLFLNRLDGIEQSICALFRRGFPKLRHLEVTNSPSIHYIHQSPSHIDFETLESLILKNLINLEKLCHNYISSKSFSALKVIRVKRCCKMKFLFPLSLLRGLPQLEEIEVFLCKLMRGIVDANDGGGVELHNLHVLKLLTLPDIKSFFTVGTAPLSGTLDDQVGTQIAFFNRQQVAFSRLETLRIYDLNNVEVLFFPSMIKSLAQLRYLDIRSCKKMKAIITEEEGLGLETSEILEFPMLINLNLQYLKSLMCFFHGKRSQETRSQDRVKSCSTSLFSQKISIPSLESLTMEELPNLKDIWSSGSPLELSNLQYLTVVKCESLLKVISSRSLVKLPKLHNLCVRYCNSMQEIFDLDGPSTSEDVEVLSKLTTLELNSLGSLRCIWNKNPCGIVNLHNLKTLEANGCPNLKFMFFPSMVKSLTQLRDLRVQDCQKMEAIIMEEEGSGLETSETLALPMLTTLYLQCLASLMCFSCKKCSQKARIQDYDQSHSATLFSQKVAFPNLENLYIKGMDNIEMIWDDQIPTDSFSKLEWLSVEECKKVVNVVPSFIVGRLLSLEILEAKACESLEVVFKLQPLNPLDGNSVAHSPLKKLNSMDLPKLNRVWDKELCRHITFQCLHLVTLKRCAKLTSLSLASIARDLIQLEELEINQCGIVELIEKEGPNELSINVEAIEGPSHELKVASSFPSDFQHMKTLDVSLCDGLSNMFTLTIAENLVGLTKLRISKCEILTEVISDEGGMEGHVVTFNQLKYMELDELTMLRYFGSGGYTLMFPLLEDIIVNRCPKMKFFHEGPIEAPKLERVRVCLNEGYGATNYRYFWNGNLNKTIQNMFEEMAMFVGTKFMRLFEFPELIGKWHNELNPITSSWQLQSLMVDKCPFIYAIPSSLMLVLERMTSLQVCDCEHLEEIFDLERLEVVDCIRVLPQLQDLYLVNLPKLRQLWNKDLQGTMCLNSLRYLSLYKCRNLIHAFVPSMARCLSNLYRIEIKECDQMKGVIIDEEGQGSMVEEITFTRLRYITLECLPSLTSFLSGKNHMLECPLLSKLIIAHCPEMRSLTWQSSMEIDNGTPSLFTPQVQFPKLTLMDLSHMDNLNKIWTDGPQETLNFNYLWTVKVQNCKSFENLFSYWVATSLTQLKYLQVESCEIEEIVASGDDTPRSNTTQDLFPNLTSLVLHDMPRLKSFCPNLPTLNWPSLKELRVTHCDKLNMLAFAASMNSWAQRDDQQDLSDQEAHSSFERDFPKFERLLLVNNNIQMIQDGNFPDDIFSKPKALTLACFHDEKATFPSIFLLERFQNLQSLELFCNFFEDIFPDEGFIEEGKHFVLENLRELKLSKLHNLKRVWREDSLVSKILQSIETFEVWDCPRLTTIFPTMTSFQNLTRLVVKNSSGLVHIVTASSVTNLVHLKWMTIIGCERMKEVVVDDRDEEGKVIIFGNLFELTLQHLPSLECFSSISSCSFKFPLLMAIEVEECPKMKTFSKGTLRTPNLRRGKLFKYQCQEGDDLNTIIPKFSA